MLIVSCKTAAHAQYRFGKKYSPAQHWRDVTRSSSCNASAIATFSNFYNHEIVHKVHIKSFFLKYNPNTDRCSGLLQQCFWQRNPQPKQTIGNFYSEIPVPSFVPLDLQILAILSTLLICVISGATEVSGFSTMKRCWWSTTTTTGDVL